MLTKWAGIAGLRNHSSIFPDRCYLLKALRVWSGPVVCAVVNIRLKDNETFLIKLQFMDYKNTRHLLGDEPGTLFRSGLIADKVLYSNSWVFVQPSHSGLQWNQIAWQCSGASPSYVSSILRWEILDVGPSYISNLWGVISVVMKTDSCSDDQKFLQLLRIEWG